MIEIRIYKGQDIYDTYILKYVGLCSHEYEMIVNGTLRCFKNEKDVRNSIQQHQTENYGATYPTTDFVTHLRKNFYNDLSSDIVVPHDSNIHGIIF